MNIFFFLSGKSSWLEDRFLVFTWGTSSMMSPSLWILSKWRSKTKLQLSNPETCCPLCSQTGFSSNVKGESWLILKHRQWLVYVIGLCYELVSKNKTSFVIEFTLSCLSVWLDLESVKRHASGHTCRGFSWFHLLKCPPWYIMKITRIRAIYLITVPGKIYHGAELEGAGAWSNGGIASTAERKRKIISVHLPLHPNCRGHMTSCPWLP